MFDIELKFAGEDADEGVLNFYDAAKALVGFERSLALTTHLVLNGEIITQSPSLRGAEIYLPHIEEGSWKAKAVVALSAATVVLSAGKDSPLGHVVTSVYDYVLSETMGFHPDYDKTLQQQYHEHLREKGITKEKLDSLSEKIETSVAEIHRPLAITGTAASAQISTSLGNRRLGPPLSLLTYDYVKQTIKEDEIVEIVGVVTSYNLNTYKGRFLVFDEHRPIPFELTENARNKRNVAALTSSQHFNGQDRSDPRAILKLKAQKLVSTTGRLKRLHVTAAERAA
jgi:hypothetical protein